MWISGLLIAGSLLAVVVGDALVTQGQVRLSTTEQALAGALAQQKALQLDVAGKAAPPVVVSQAKSQGLVAASQVVDLPQVPLNVPLPPPKIVAEPAGTTAPSSPPPANATPPKAVGKASTPAPATASAATPAPATASTATTATTATTTPTAPTTATTTPTTPTTPSAPAPSSATPQ